MQYKTWLAAPSESTEFLEATEGDYTLSQTARFGEALARAFAEYEYEPRMFEFSGGQKVLLPLVRVRRRPRFLRCYEAMPFSLNGMPATADSPLSRDHVVAILERVRPDFFQLNAGATSAAVWKTSSFDGLLETVGGSSHVLALDEGMDAIWTRRFSAKVRNQCRSAERRGVEVRVATRQEEFGSYYSIYEAATAGWGQHTPRYPRALFRELGTLLGRGVELKLAYVGGRPIAGILLFHGRRSTLYWSAAVLKEFRSYSPHNALLRAAIEEACARGMTKFDFGGSGNLESVRAFKESFGARPVDYCSYVLMNTRYRLLRHLKDLLPRSIRRAL
jgi:CelD/BcsL family acetyltransferase involved in cellulose biosynthesis